MQSPLDPTVKRWTLVLCCLAQFMVILDVSVVNVALPSIRSDLASRAVDLQWVVNAYALTFAGFLLLGGRAADLLGQPPGVRVRARPVRARLAGRRPVAAEGQLVVARAVQGLGGAVVAPGHAVHPHDDVRRGRRAQPRARAWGAMGGAGGAAGVLLGGMLTDVLGWQWILFINVPIGVGAALAAQPASRAPRAAATERHYDAAGALSVTAGLVVLTFGIVRTDTQGWGSAVTLGPMAGGLALLALFLAIEGALVAGARWCRCASSPRAR